MPESVRSMPRLRAIDSSASFLLDGYTFGARRFDRLGSDAFHTRLMFTPATFMRGEEAARLFYEGDRFARAGLRVDLSEDAEPHRLRDVFEDEWANAVADWTFRPSVTLHIELLDLLTRSALRWAGVPISGTELEARAGELGDILESARRQEAPAWSGRLKRLRAHRWARKVVRSARRGELTVESGTPLLAIVEHSGAGLEPLDDDAAAAELVGVLQPIVAVARFTVFAALALHANPHWYATFRSGNDTDLDNFVREVRRFFPFFPAVAGRVRSPFEGMGYRFRRHDWVLLDLYGTNHDPHRWRDPSAFRPERFRSVDAAAGDPWASDPGALDLMRESVRLLTRGVTYTVADQDLRVSLRRFPAIPRDGFVIRNVSASGPAQP